MNILGELVQVLEDGNIGEAGKTIFIDDIPAGINQAYMVRMTSSLPVDIHIPVIQPAVQIMHRAPTSQQATEGLYDVIRLLHTFEEQTWGDIDVMQCQCISEPQFLIKDESNRVTYATTFQLYVRWEQ